MNMDVLYLDVLDTFIQTVKVTVFVHSIVECIKNNVINASPMTLDI